MFMFWHQQSLSTFYLFQREKDRVPEDGEKWLKPNSVRHRRVSRLQQPLSHSHEVGTGTGRIESNHRKQTIQVRGDTG